MTWTREELDYLRDKWGSVSLKTLAKNLNKSEAAVLLKKNRLGLGRFLENGNYITFNQLILALGRAGGGYIKTSWINSRNFPVKTQKVGSKSFMVVYLDDFWEWAENNKGFIDFSKVEENILGKEPAWVKQQRKADIEDTKYIATPWTEIEDKHLKDLLKTYRYSYLELSQKLHRSAGAIQRRVIDLGLKERPIKADNMIKWTEEELDKLMELILSGTSYNIMAEKLNKSSKAIRGKVYREFGSESLEVVRRVLEGKNIMLQEA